MKFHEKIFLRVMRGKAVDGAARNWMLSYQLKNVKSVHIDKYGWLNFLSTRNLSRSFQFQD